MAYNPLHTSNQENASQIYLVLVMRFSDRAILAHLTNGDIADKEGVRAQVTSNTSLKPGGRYSVSGDAQTIHYNVDSASRVYALVTHPKFPARVAFGVLDELQAAFQRDFGSRLATAPENGLSRVAKPLMKDLIEKYQSTATSGAGSDKLTSVQTKIDVVRTVMQDNIQQILANNDQVTRIASSAEQLNEQSLAFKSSTRELRAKMYWKMWKMRLLIGAVIVVVLIVIIVPVAITAKSSGA